MASMKELRYSHAEGLTLAKYGASGKCLLTAGADGDVRVYKSLSDDEVSFKVGNCVTAMSIKGNEIAVATETNEVKTYSISEGTQQQILVRFTAQVNSICYGRKSDHIAAGASDFLIKVVNKKDLSQRQLNGHSAPVLCVMFSPDDLLLASSSCDGTLKIWDIEKQECIKTIDIFPKCNDISTSKILCKIDWCSGTSKVIAVPFEKGVKLISTENWTELHHLTGQHTELVSIVKFSPCGGFIASSSINGEISIWDTVKRTHVEFMKHDTKITAFDWNPNGTKEVLFADEMGRFSVFSNVCPLVEQDKQYNAAGISDGSDSETASRTEKSKKRSFQIDDDDDDDDDEPPIGSVSKKHRVQNFDNFLDDEAGDDDEDDDYANISLNLIKEGFIPPLNSDLKEDEEGSLKDFIVEDKLKKPSSPTQCFQKAFQPGATPEHLMHRFMTWNTVGIIRCHSEDEISTIDIEFHDASLHHPLHFTNVMNHTMAALSTTAAVLACQSQDGLPSKLVCLHFGTWDSTKEWTVSMMKGEEVLSVAVNTKFVAAATSFGFVRIFTVGGLQYHVFSIAGPVVAMSMSETQLMIVYHQATGRPPSQCLGMQLLEIGKSNWKLSVEQQLPLGFKDTLIWIGFSAEETPFTVDSKGILRMFQRSFGYTWTPVLNLKAQTKTKSDNYWVVGITENPPEARAILCKAANFPATLPRPVPSALSFQIPLCDKDTEKGKLEESLAINRMVNQYHDYHRKKRLDLDDTALAESKSTEIQLLMKLFALSCKSERIFRAVEICELMPNADTVNLAIQYATKMRRMNLAQRLVELARKKADEDEMDDTDNEGSENEDSEGDVYSSSVSKRPISVKSSMNSRSFKSQEAMAYKGRRSIGRPKSYQRIQKDSEGSVPDDPDSRDEELKEHETIDDIEDIDGEDIKFDDEIEMMSENHDEKDRYATETAERSSASGNQARNNPFKLTPSSKAKAVGSSRGTSYFESLSSTMPPRNALGISRSQQKNSAKESAKQSSKKANLFSNKANSRSENSKQSSLKKAATRENSKKLSGFMLFREHLEANLEGLDGEELVSKSLEEWKSLSADEKKTWNCKAKNESGKDGKCNETQKIANMNVNSNNNTINEPIERRNENSLSSRSKLAAFAFKKTV